MQRPETSAQVIRRDLLLLFCCLTTKPQMWAMLQEMKQQLDSVNARAQDREEEMVTFSARIPKTLAQDIRRAAHLSGHKVQEVTAEALRFWLYAQQEDDLHR